MSKAKDFVDQGYTKFHGYSYELGGGSGAIDCSGLVQACVSLVLGENAPTFGAAANIAGGSWMPEKRWKKVKGGWGATKKGDIFAWADNDGNADNGTGHCGFVSAAGGTQIFHSSPRCDGPAKTVNFYTGQSGVCFFRYLDFVPIKWT